MFHSPTGSALGCIRHTVRVLKSPIWHEHVHASLQAEFGRLPAPHNKEDATKFVSIAEKLNETAADKAEIDDAVLKALSFTASGELSPMAAFFGGVVGQEVCAHVGHIPAVADLARTLAAVCMHLLAVSLCHSS